MPKIIIPLFLIVIGLFLMFKQEPEKEVIEYIYVDVKGAVKNPGNYQMPYNTRVSDVIKKAGGLRFDASTRYINLAKRLEDEMVIVIYTNEEVLNNPSDLMVTYCNCPTITNDGLFDSEENNLEKVNINTADLETLMTLTGIGKVKAQAIIDYRTLNGQFINCEDLMNVKGIGQSTYDKIKNYITV